MAAINRVQYHPPPPISFCEGPRIIKKLNDVVVQILELPLYIPSSLPTAGVIFSLLVDVIFSYFSIIFPGKFLGDSIGAPGRVAITFSC
jgi:hypothetical protein